MSASERGAPRHRPLLWIDSASWERAGARAAADHLTAARALEILLAGYAAGRVTVTPVGSSRDGKERAQRRVSLARSVLDNVLAESGKLKSGDAPSLSRLAELLVAGYADGSITLTVTAAGHAGPAREDGKAEAA